MNLTLYVVQNKEGKFFRAKGYGGYGKTWVDDINKAKIYTKIGQARGRVTFFTKNYPEYGSPVILELEATVKNVLDETIRVNKILTKLQRQEEERGIKLKERVLQIAENDLFDAKARAVVLTTDALLKLLRGN